MRKLSCLVSLLGLSCVMAMKPQDLVLGLPDVPRLNSDWFSGYIDASPTRSLHYVFISSLSNVKTDPVVVWFNGGPGCSSLLALF